MVVVSYMLDYDTSLQNATDIIIKYNSYFIRKYDKSSLLNAWGVFLQDMTVSLENVTAIPKCNGFITKYGVYYKIRLSFSCTWCWIVNFCLWVIVGLVLHLLKSRDDWIDRITFLEKTTSFIFHLYFPVFRFYKSLSRSEAATLMWLLFEDSKVSSVYQSKLLVR